MFDCLSDLQSAWATDLMLGNFFSITCPYLFELDTIAYFALLRNNHSFKTVARIRETTQLLIDVYNTETSVYIHPLKVLNRYTPTMFFPHLKKGKTFTPIINSIESTLPDKAYPEEGAGKHHPDPRLLGPDLPEGGGPRPCRRETGKSARRWCGSSAG